ADMDQHGRDVCFVPKADSCKQQIMSSWLASQDFTLNLNSGRIRAAPSFAATAARATPTMDRMFMMAFSFSPNKTRCARPVPQPTAPPNDHGTARDGLGYVVKWSAE